VVVQDEHGNQVVVTPKMARQLAKELASMADVADGVSLMSAGIS
jgi:hypothetical protein